MSEEIRYTEKCGVFGMVGVGIKLQDVQDGCNALSHRGDDSVGLLYSDGKSVGVNHGTGDMGSLFDGVPNGASVFVGHNRYATSSIISDANAQPFVAKNSEFFLGLAHNGNLPADCVTSLKEKFSISIGDDASDSRVVTQVLFAQHKKYPTWLQTFLQTLPFFQGSFSFVVATNNGCIYAMRDPWGIRPLCLGRKGKASVVASETVAFDAMGADYVREIKPGEIVCLRPNGTVSSLMYSQSSSPEKRCLLETIYFSHKKSFDGMSHIWQQRRALGRQVGKRFLEKRITVDLVIPILNSGKEISMGVEEVLGIHSDEAITTTTKKRSFIQNTDEARKKVVNEKHIVDGNQVRGKRILLCDDSLVRGNSLGVLIEKLKVHKPLEIHIVLGSEPVIDICDLGVDLPKQENLLAARVSGGNLSETEKNVALTLGVDSVTYLTRQNVQEALGKTSANMCWHCFGGDHPIRAHSKPSYATFPQETYPEESFAVDDSPFLPLPFLPHSGQEMVVFDAAYAQR